MIAGRLPTDFRWPTCSCSYAVLLSKKVPSNNSSTISKTRNPLTSTNGSSPEQFGQSFGVAQQDLDAITQWLQSHGFTVNSIYPSRMLIDFSGTAGQIREAFHTEIHNLDVNGISAYRQYERSADSRGSGTGDRRYCLST